MFEEEARLSVPYNWIVFKHSHVVLCITTVSVVYMDCSRFLSSNDEGR